jgi:ribosomal protein L40E
MAKRGITTQAERNENLMGYSVIIVFALVLMLIVYIQQGLTIYVLLIPLIITGALFFIYETFKIFLRMVGREIEMGKKQAEEEKGSGKLLMLVCPKCKAKNPSDAEFCFRCGEKL